MNGSSIAEALRRGEAAAVAAVATRVLPIRPDNLVPRPWGGRRLFAYKGLDEPAGAETFGEVFEVSGDRRDAESGAHPSVVVLDDGSEISLLDLLDAAGEGVLGADVFAEHGPNLPLLPKTLDVHGLLSVQAHPAGSPEAYYVLDAEPGATLRVGFVRDLEPDALRDIFMSGREAQESLLHDLLAEDADLVSLQDVLAEGLDQAAGPEDLLQRIRPFLAPEASAAEAKALLSCLAGAWRQVLGLLTEVPAVPGTLLFNATPPEAGPPRSAEVHALGNPEGRFILLLEVRRPAPTYRAWDHVRFPLRELDIEKTLGAMRLEARDAASFPVEPEAVAGHPGLFRSAACEAFVVDHARPDGDAPVALPPDARVRTLHVVAGSFDVAVEGGGEPVRLRRGESALLPAGLTAARLVPVERPAEAIVVSLPDPEAA